MKGLPRLPPLTIGAILAWADDCRRRNGQWPTHKSGAVPGTTGETWLTVDAALRRGRRGLPGGSSLPQLLQTHRDVRNIKNLPALTIETILAWADHYHASNGRWPTKQESSPILDTSKETWVTVNEALRKGIRGLAGGSSLAKLLDEHRNVRNRAELPRLTVGTILAWADDCRRRNGRWPTHKSGAVPGTTGETWLTVDAALRRGRRGLPGHSSLAKLLNQHRRKREKKDRPA